MKSQPGYLLEHAFLAIVAVLTVTGFWRIYFGADAAPGPHHHLHVATNFIWLSLLWWQLRLVATRNYAGHRKVGLSILAIAPLLVGSGALLSVHSAHKGLVSGQGDFLIIQNVGVTLELGLVILLAFALRKRRKLHGAMILSSAMLFMGIALFFSLLSFVPAFRIEGPDTFYRFGTAAATGLYICLAVGLVFLVRDFRYGWPMLMAAGFFSLNGWIRSYLSSHDLIDPLTRFVGMLNPAATFFATFALMFALLAATGLLRRGPDNAFRGKALREPA